MNFGELLLFVVPSAYLVVNRYLVRLGSNRD